MDDKEFLLLVFSQPDHWSNRIPLGIRIKIGDRVKEQLHLLPVNLFLEWHEPRFLRERWFLEAAHYIEIPFFYEYWGMELIEYSDR